MEATALDQTSMDPTTSDESSETANRMRYEIQGTTLNVKRGNETLQASPNTLPDEVRQHLMMTGLIDYLQRACARTPKEQKMDAVEEAMNRLDQEGMKVFERKPRGFQSTGPRKQDKIAALAVLQGATPTAVEKALANRTKDEQDKILNHPDVLQKVSEMASNVQL